MNFLQAESDRLQRHQDALLEDEIEREYQAMVDTECPLQRRYHERKMRELIGQRSPERVSEMEQERGLVT